MIHTEVGHYVSRHCANSGITSQRTEQTIVGILSRGFIDQYGYTLIAKHLPSVAIELLQHFAFTERQLLNYLQQSRLPLDEFSFQIES